MTRHKSHKNFFFRFSEKMFKTIILDNVSRIGTGLTSKNETRQNSIFKGLQNYKSSFVRCDKSINGVKSLILDGGSKSTKFGKFIWTLEIDCKIHLGLHYYLQVRPQTCPQCATP